MNIFFASPEVAPFAKTGGLADVAGSLPKALHEISCKVTVILPYYKCVKEMNLRLKPFKVEEFSFLELTKDNVRYVFLVNDGYYMRDNLYSEPTGDYPDNHLRFSYYCRAIASLALYEKPNLIHCNDWETGLVPLYLKIKKSNIKTLFTIHNIGYQGLFKKDVLKEIAIPSKFYNIKGIEYYRKVSFLKAGIVYSTAISTVSKRYSEEILTPKFGCGMDGILNTRLPDVYGILNGVDYSMWDPKTDKHIIANYTSNTLDKKKKCKEDIIKSVKLPENTMNRPLIGIITRLAEQKGIDLIVDAAKEIIELGASIVLLGTGDEKYNSLCRRIGEVYPEYISSNVTFDNALAHKIEAGSDMFLMPSRYEPCGLNQLYSLRYGTVPIVRATGGLDDTIRDLNLDKKKGNGIKFENATKENMLDAVSRAIKLYNNKELWTSIQQRIMNLDFSWKTSALHYKDLYTRLT